MALSPPPGYASGPDMLISVFFMERVRYPLWTCETRKIYD